MALDPAVRAALYEATKNVGQPDVVARRLAAWLDEKSKGESGAEQELNFYENVMRELVPGGVTDAD